MPSQVPDDLLQRSPEEACCRLTYRLLEESLAAAQRLRVADEEDALQDFLLAVPRLCSWAKSWRRHLGAALPGKEYQALRQLEQAMRPTVEAQLALAQLESLGEALTTEEFRGLSYLAGQWQRRWSAGRERVREQMLEGSDALLRRLGQGLKLSLSSAKLGPLADASSCFRSELASRFGCSARDLQVALKGMEGVEDQDELYALRLAVKRLHDLLEATSALLLPGLAPALPCVKQLQGQLLEIIGAYELAAELSRLLDGGDLSETEKKALGLEPGLLELARRNRERLKQSFAAFARLWLGEENPLSLRELFGHLANLQAGLENSLPEQGVEIERKYLLEALPEGFASWDCEEIDQGWLPGEKLQERVRRIRRGGEERYFRCVKAGRGIRRLELEEEASAELFAVLWPLTLGCRVQKKRYRPPTADPKQEWLVDVFCDRELWLCEVELSHEDLVPEPIPAIAAVLGAEVTDDGRYVNRMLAK
ncbi:MAG: hypothetical protein CSA62_03915 [Planctomycetota bacterium]|nr:MAG: hypothetical protein CSA62_03915 [Planctomycetota bacterium]